MTAARVPAVGGTRDVPAPDDVARDYLLLGLRLDQQLPGTVDGYFGPAELKARVDMEPLRSPARLAEDALALRSRLPAEVPEPDRRHWLDLQLIAVETLARIKAGESIPYLDQVERCLALRPERRDDAMFERAATALDERLPGHGGLAERLKAEDDAWTVPPDRVQAVVEALVARYRARAASLYALPEGESLRVSLVRGQPWSGYNWYDGGYRSRVDINLDLPIRLPNLVATVAHETYPGHHLEHAEKERRLVEELGRLESSILLINAPECLISEGLANLGVGIAARPEELPGLLTEMATIGELPMAVDPAALREAVDRQADIAAQRAILGEARVNAALMLHVDGESRERVAAYLVEVGRSSPETAAKRLEFISHPLWRLYDFVYTEGEAMLRRWLEVVPPAERDARFGRLLTESLTPPAIRAETAAALAEPRSVPGRGLDGPAAAQFGPRLGRARDGLPGAIRARDRRPAVGVEVADHRPLAVRPRVLGRVEERDGDVVAVVVGRAGVDREVLGDALGGHPGAELVDRGIRVAAGVVADDEDLAVVRLGARQVLDAGHGVADRDLEAVPDLQPAGARTQPVPQDEADRRERRRSRGR